MEVGSTYRAVHAVSRGRLELTEKTMQAPGPGKVRDRRTARMGLVGDGRAAGVRNVAADYQALAPSAPSSCRSRARWLVMPRRRQGLARRFGAYLH